MVRLVGDASISTEITVNASHALEVDLLLKPNVTMSKLDAGHPYPSSF